MSVVNLLYSDHIDITDKIKIVIPKVGDIIDNEDLYYSIVALLTSMPIDMMVQLDDIGIDFTEINAYQLFLTLFAAIKQHDTRLIFGDLDLSKFELAENSENGDIVLLDSDNDIVIDRSIYGMISASLRKIHNIEKNNKRPANKEAKEYMLERARKKLRRSKNQKFQSQIEPLIISMVNTEQFKYNFDTVRDLSIYQFNESVRQVIHKIDYDNRMYGVYTGSISAKDLSQDDFNWLSHK